MIRANYHTHTTRCHHAVGTEREYIEQAIREGFSVLGFSDHVPMPYKSDIRMDQSQIADYIDTLQSLKEEYKGTIDILIGYEVEYSIKYFDRMLDEITKYPVDYIIQGQHFVPDEVNGVYEGNPTTDEKILKDYVDFTIEGMKTGLFSYLAHPDLVNYVGDSKTYLKHMERLITAANNLELPLEVNMYGFIDKRIYPNDLFFDLASKMESRFVIGCDAHYPGLVVQPEHLPGFSDFLQRHNIDCGDNIVELKKISCSV